MRAEILLATHNEGKIKEMRALLAPAGIAVITAADLDLPVPDETGVTFRDNAAIKAMAAASISGRAALADDSGLCVHALDNWPGVYTADLAGPDRDYPAAMKVIHDRLGDAPDRSASFHCVLALAQPEGACEYFEGRIDGSIAWPPRGDKGFGYEPVFMPRGDTRTFAEMSVEEKNRFSHRGLAFAALLSHLAFNSRGKENPARL